MNNKKINNYIIGLAIIIFFDGALTLSQGIRILIYLFQGIWIPVLLMGLPMTFFTTLLVFEVTFLTKFLKIKNRLKDSSDEINFLAFHQLQTQNPKLFKIEMIFHYIACGFIVCLGFLGVVPLCFMISGHKAYNRSLEAIHPELTINI